MACFLELRSTYLVIDAKTGQVLGHDFADHAKVKELQELLEALFM